MLPSDRFHGQSDCGQANPANLRFALARPTMPGPSEAEQPERRAAAASLCVIETSSHERPWRFFVASSCSACDPMSMPSPLLTIHGPEWRAKVVDTEQWKPTAEERPGGEAQ